MLMVENTLREIKKKKMAGKQSQKTKSFRKHLSEKNSVKEVMTSLVFMLAKGENIKDPL